jgi:uncharacterized protein (DUF924 family)
MEVEVGSGLARPHAPAAAVRPVGAEEVDKVIPPIWRHRMYLEFGHAGNLPTTR